MFSIEHEFDSTVITLVDEPEAGEAQAEDVVVTAFEDRVTLRQHGAGGEGADGEGAAGAATVTLTMAQVRDLAVALDLPEGVYRRLPDG